MAERAQRWRWLLAGLLLLVLLGLAQALLSLPTPPAGLQAAVQNRLGESGVEHPVTAVLLNFRGYDTLLELGVLLLAILGVWSLGRAPAPPAWQQDPLLEALAALLTPLMILVSGYLLWVGAIAPGGAFQAGAVLGAAGVLILLAGQRLPGARPGALLRPLIGLGVAVFALVGVLAMLPMAAFLQYPPAWAKHLILLIEAAATLSIGATLAALFIGGEPERRP